MKSQTVFRRLARLALLLVALSTLNSQLSTVHAQGTAFTYQGVLQDGGTPATGLYDLEFRVFDAATGGAQVGLLTTANDLPVTNGLFTVTIDAGASVFTGASRWLNIAVRPGASAGAYTNLSPRQPLAPTPYAIYAGGANAAGLSGTVPAASIASNSITSAMLADGAVTSNKLASAIGQWVVSGGNVYRGSGNVGIGTASPVEKLNVSGVLRLDSDNARLSLQRTTGANYIDFNNGHQLILRSIASDGSSGPNRMTIDTAGRVGIGTTSPAFGLHVQDPGSQTGRIHVGGTSAGPDMKVVSFGDGDFVFIGENGEDDRMELHATRFYFSGGDVGIGTTNPATKLDIAGEATMTACNITSDRNAKEDFKPVSARSVLEKVASLAITEWQYKEQPGVRHIGPVAQDFREAFGVGRDEKHITTVDADGVALAAIQGLNEKVDEKDARIRELEREMAELKTLLNHLAGQLNGGAR